MASFWHSHKISGLTVCIPVIIKFAIDIYFHIHVNSSNN